MAADQRKKIAQDTEAHMKDIRQQLSEQLKCLDTRLEGHVAMLGELQDFYRRRAEVELDYSRNMDKLVKQIMTRHKADKQRREAWPGYSTYTVWQTLLCTTRKLGKDHGVLAELYNSCLSNRFVELTEDVQRIYKKCREMALTSHEELVKVLNELHSSMKTYHLYYNACLQAEGKLRQVENQRVKVEQQANTRTNTLSRRFRNFEKQIEKKQAKYAESKLKAVKARNEYLLCLEAANAAVQKYFVDDLQELINTMDYGYHGTLGHTVLMHIAAEDNMIVSRQGCLDLLNQRVRDLDQRVDKQTFLDMFPQTFLLPRPFEFQAHKGDEVDRLSAQKPVQDDLLDRLNTINERLNTLRLENEEIWKTLETTDSRLLEMIALKDNDVTTMFQDDTTPARSPMERDKRRTDRRETEEFYLNKFRDYQTSNNLIARLQAKYNCIENALNDSNCTAVRTASPTFGSLNRPPCVPSKPKRRRTLGKAPQIGQPKLFGGTIEEYVEATGEDIPLVVRSCIRIINLYGMHHQGVFRVPGAQHEINDFKNQFERGKDPLPDKVDGKDINSVAGVLKLYFRELREPLVTAKNFDELVACSAKYNFNNPDDVVECLCRVREVISTLPRSVYIVMRYLFAFLSHLSEFSDENMMDTYNLAICFGPTLLPTPSERDQVQFQGHVNELVRNFIVHQEELFTIDCGGTLYERCIVEDDGEREDSVENLSEDDDQTADVHSEEDAFIVEPGSREAVALYDFQGRTERELTFKKGDTLLVFDQVSGDWWEGAFHGREGLVPDRYILIRQRERDSSSVGRSRDNECRWKSTESLPAPKTSGPPVRTASTSSEEQIDLSLSQPNVFGGRLALTTPPPPQTTSRPSSVLSTDSTESSMSSMSIMSSSVAMSVSSGTSRPERHSSVEMRQLPEFDSSTKKIETIRTTSSEWYGIGSSADDLDADKSPEDLALDIDNALAEVMSGIESLGRQHAAFESSLVEGRGRDSRSPSQNVPATRISLCATSTSLKHTPDLVLDLPVSVVDQREQSPRTSKLGDSPPALTTAEVFADSNQCTIKKSGAPTTSAHSPHTNESNSVNSSGTNVCSSGINPNRGHPVKKSNTLDPTITRRPLPERPASCRLPSRTLETDALVQQHPLRLDQSPQRSNSVNQRTVEPAHQQTVIEMTSSWRPGTCTTDTSTSRVSQRDSRESASPARTARSPSRVERLSDTSWASSFPAVDLDLESEFVRSIVSPFMAQTPTPAVPRFPATSSPRRATSDTSADMHKYSTTGTSEHGARTLEYTSTKMTSPQNNTTSTKQYEFSPRMSHYLTHSRGYSPSKSEYPADILDEYTTMSMTSTGEPSLTSISDYLSVTSQTGARSGHAHNPPLRSVSMQERSRDIILEQQEQQQQQQQQNMKPPIKAKPPVMKKPARSAEMMKRIQDAQGYALTANAGIHGDTTALRMSMPNV